MLNTQEDTGSVMGKRLELCIQDLSKLNDEKIEEFDDIQKHFNDLIQENSELMEK